MENFNNALYDIIFLLVAPKEKNKNILIRFLSFKDRAV